MAELSKQANSLAAACLDCLLPTLLDREFYSECIPDLKFQLLTNSSIMLITRTQNLMMLSANASYRPRLVSQYSQYPINLLKAL